MTDKKLTDEEVVKALECCKEEIEALYRINSLC